MTSHSDLAHLKRVSKANYILLSIFICLSMTSHLIAFRLVAINGVPLFPSSLTYMMCFILTDIMATYNPVKFIWMVIIIESIVNFLLIVITREVIHSPYPDFLINAHSYVEVFSPLINLYLANILGSFIGFAANTFIFMFFFDG